MGSAINYTEEELFQIIDALPLAASVIDQDHRVALANKVTLAFVNKGEELLIGKVGGKAFDCVNADAPEGCGFGTECSKCALRTSVKDTMRDRAPHTMVETTMSFKTKGTLHLRISTLPVTLELEQMVILCVEDITQAQIHEETRIANEQLMVAIETAGEICHELNQPLQTALSRLELMLLDEPDSQRFIKMEKIIADLSRMGEITGMLHKIVSYKTRSYGGE